MFLGYWEQKSRHYQFTLRRTQELPRYIKLYYYLPPLNTWEFYNFKVTEKVEIQTEIGVWGGMLSNFRNIVLLRVIKSTVLNFGNANVKEMKKIPKIAV